MPLYPTSIYITHLSSCWIVMLVITAIIDYRIWHHYHFFSFMTHKYTGRSSIEWAYECIRVISSSKKQRHRHIWWNIMVDNTKGSSFLIYWKYGDIRYCSDELDVIDYVLVLYFNRRIVNDIKDQVVDNILAGRIHIALGMVTWQRSSQVPYLYSYNQKHVHHVRGWAAVFERGYVILVGEGRKPWKHVFLSVGLIGVDCVYKERLIVYQLMVAFWFSHLCKRCPFGYGSAGCWGLVQNAVYPSSHANVGGLCLHEVTHLLIS